MFPYARPRCPSLPRSPPRFNLAPAALRAAGIPLLRRRRRAVSRLIAQGRTSPPRNLPPNLPSNSHSQGIKIESNLCGWIFIKIELKSFAWKNFVKPRNIRKNIRLLVSEFAVRTSQKHLKLFIRSCRTLRLHIDTSNVFFLIIL